MACTAPSAAATSAAFRVAEDMFPFQFIYDTRAQNRGLPCIPLSIMFELMLIPLR